MTFNSNVYDVEKC